MAMGLNKGGGLTCEMNITPMIDVLLVLIIIFMMIQPHERGLNTEVPQTSTTPDKAPPSPSTIVLEIVNGADGRPVVRINGTVVPPEALEAKLRHIYKSRQEKILFLKGDATLTFSEIAKVIDITRSADDGIRVGLITRDLQNAD